MTDQPITNEDSVVSIQSTIIPSLQRAQTLPAYFPHTFIVMESAAYRFADVLCKEYSGAYWEFHSLSNGGFYMSPDLKDMLRVEVPFGNAYLGQMSADAFGIVVCLYVYSALAEEHPAVGFDDYYWSLRDFADGHKEASAIYGAID